MGTPRSRQPWPTIAVGAVLVLVGAARLPAQQAAADPYPPQEVWAPPDSCTVLLDDFDSYDTGKRPPLWQAYGTDDQAKARLTVEAVDEAQPQDRALVLTGPLGPATKEMPVEAARWLLLPAAADGVRVSVKGDSGGHDFHVRLIDKDDETFGYILGPVASEEWVTHTISLTETPPQYSYGQKHNGRLDPPLRLQSVGVAVRPDGRHEGEFRVLVDDIGITVGPTESIPVWTPGYATVQDEVGLAMQPPVGTASGTLELAQEDELIYPVLAYDWGQELPRPNSYLEVAFQVETGAGDGTLFFWVQGDGSRAYVIPRMVDADGECWQFQWAQATAVTWRGWRCLSMDIAPERTAAYVEHWGGDGAMQPPYRFLSIVVDDLQPYNQVPDLPTGELTGRIGFGPVYYVPWK